MHDKSKTPAATLLICFCFCGEVLLLIFGYLKSFTSIPPYIRVTEVNVCTVCVELHAFIISSFFLFSFFPHLADSHPSYPPSMCVKREPHEASFAPFTPSSVGDSGLADILPHQSSLSIDASTPSYPAHAHGPCYSQFTSQAFIAGTTLSIRPDKQNQNPIKLTLIS